MCKRARDLRPDMAFGADIIAGFPTESEEMFQNSLNIVEECDITYLHVFPYSERDGTPAARIPNKVPVPERKERAARLRVLGKSQTDRLLRQNINKTHSILVEKGGVARTENFLPVSVPNDLPIGSLARMQTECIEDDRLVGSLLDLT